jgi:periplasmic protein TonB
MSGFAPAYNLTGSLRGWDRRRRTGRTVKVPWNDVPMAPSVASPSGSSSRQHVYVALVAVAAILLHAAFVSYVTHHVQVRSAPARHQVEVQIVTPPQPLPKVEPPKPPPPRARVVRHVVPQIQTAVPDTPVVDSAPSEAPVQVAPSAPPPPAPPPPPEPEPVTAPFGRAGYLNNPPPEYPATAARQGWQGTVLLRVRVLSTGKVDSVEVQKSSGHKVLDDQAITTVHGWLFAPSKRGVTPIDGWATVPIEFKLDT